MKTLYSAIALLICGLVGCDQREPTMILSVCIFEPTEAEKVPTRADLIALKAYADTAYNPSGLPNLIDSDETEEIGYLFRFSSNQPINTSEPTGFSQSIPSDPNSVQYVAAGRVEPNSNGTYTLSVYVGGGDGENNDDKFVKTTLSGASAGTLKLADGWVAAWFLKPEQG